ncbi:MAG: hypothetical protein JO142_19235 [Burkholderiales bacterium]|nr:hypothetical protein [Burkholderiales bacterium]
MTTLLAAQIVVAVAVAAAANGQFVSVPLDIQSARYACADWMLIADVFMRGWCLSV